MIADSRKAAELEGRRWKAVRLGLRLANSYLGVGVIGFFYALWCLIGLSLGLVLIAFAVRGKADAFKEAMNPIGLYGFLLPIALMAAAVWVVKLFSRLLWCGIPKPLTATFLAFASVTGRLSVVFAIGYIWFSGGPFRKGLLLPETIACSGIAWFGLIADWGFVRTLRRDLIPAAGRAKPSNKLDNALQNTTGGTGQTEQNKKGIFTRDIGEWFKGRHPRGHKFVVWILVPLAYVAVSSLADNGDLQAIPNAILRMAVIYPAVLQVFWIPREEIARILKALSEEVVPEKLHSTC